jgi:hypothetical protein
VPPRVVARSLSKTAQRHDQELQLVYVIQPNSVPWPTYYHLRHASDYPSCSSQAWIFS